MKFDIILHVDEEENEMMNVRNAKAFCSEDIALIENYSEAVSDKREVWDIHHRRETDDGISRRELKERGEYWHRPASELIFLRHDVHRHLHGLNLPDETRKNMSEAQSLLRWWNNGEKEIKAKSCPDGYSAGRLNSEDLAQQRSEAQHCKAVEQYSKDSKLLNTFESVSMASKEIGIQKTNIIHCCREIRQTAGGYKWKYK